MFKLFYCRENEEDELVFEFDKIPTSQELTLEIESFCQENGLIIFGYDVVDQDDGVIVRIGQWEDYFKLIV